MKSRVQFSPAGKRIIIVVATVLTIVACFLLVGVFHLGDEAAVGVFALAATLVGTIFIPVEIKNSQEVTCCQMLIDQNNYFHDNDHLMKVYRVLERMQCGENGSELWKDVEETDIACYCTFFENLYLLYSHKIARIEDLDDLFGYRFFIFANNPYVQENHILPTSSSYSEIFQLYEAWIAYRRKKGAHVPGDEYAFTEAYLHERLYLHDVGFPSKETRSGIRKLGFQDIPQVLSLQERACEELQDKTVFYPLSREELIESLHLDTVLGNFAPDGSLRGFALFVSCRNSPRNLGFDAGLPWERSYTFDVVVSDPSCRGLGIHKQFIDCAVEEARRCGATAVLATVSPDNAASMHNFEAKGFEVLKENLEKYSALRRTLLCRKV